MRQRIDKTINRSNKKARNITRKLMKTTKYLTQVLRNSKQLRVKYKIISLIMAIEENKFDLD